MKKISKAEQARKEQIGRGINESIIKRGREINDKKREEKQVKGRKVYA